MAVGTKKQVKVAVGILAVLGALVVVGGLVEWFRQKRSVSGGGAVLASVESSETDSDATLVTRN